MKKEKTIKKKNVATGTDTHLVTPYTIYLLRRFLWILNSHRLTAEQDYGGLCEFHQSLDSCLF